MIRAIAEILSEEVDDGLLFFEGELISERPIVFWDRVGKHTLGMGLVVDDDRKLGDFNLVRILPQWILHEGAPNPILAYTQRETIFLVQGLHWHVM